MSALDPIKVYDARWEVSEFNDEQVRRLFESTYIYGRQLGVDTLTLTRDARLGGPRVLEIAMAEALRVGLRVFVRPEQTSTPQSYFTALHVSQKYPNTMGLVITASHNPAQYIGVKFTIPGVKAIGAGCGPLDGLTRIREIYHSSQKLADAPDGSVHILDLTHEYIDFSMRQAGVAPGSLKGLSLVLDAFHGSCGAELFQALCHAGVKVYARRLIPDGQFPSGSPNPTSQGKMIPAVELAGKLNADAVIGVDGDGDRIVFGDRRGILTAGFAFVPILQGCLPPGQTGVPALYDPKVSPLALAEWGKLGVKPVLFRNGHSQIKDYMTQIGAPLAAEESGHYYHRITMGSVSTSSENSAITILLFLKALKNTPGLLDKLWDLEKRIFTTGEFNYQFANDAVRDRALATVVKHFAGQGAAVVTTTPDGIDLQGTCLSKGVRLDPGNVKLEPGWYSGYLRIATNEKGVVRSYFSAADTVAGKRVENETRDILTKEFDGKVID